MQLRDDSLEFIFSGTDFINIGREDNILFDFYNLTIVFKGVCRLVNMYGNTEIFIKLSISNMRNTVLWICYSLLLNDAENFSDDVIEILPKKEMEIEIPLENYEIAFENNHRASIHLVLEDQRRRILGRCHSICVDYNVISGRYRYQIFNKFSKGNRSYRELDIQVNKMTSRRYFSDDWSYSCVYNTIPIVITNCTDRNRSFVIERLEFDGGPIDKIIGINDMSDAIFIDGWESHKIEIVINKENFVYDGAELLFVFRDLATNNRYYNLYSFNSTSRICKISHSYVFIHDVFEHKILQ